MKKYTHFLVRLRVTRTVVIVVVCVSVVLVLNTNFRLIKTDTNFSASDVHSVPLHNFLVERFYLSHKYWKLSKLGNVLYKNEEYPQIKEERRNRTFLILIWKHWNWLKSRHLYNYGKQVQDPFSECSVRNCEFTGDDDKLQTADAVVVHLLRGNIPSTENRNLSQRWIFLNDESPRHAFSQSNHYVPMETLHNVFNWSMTYMCNADIPVPYGRTVALEKPKIISSDPPIADLIPNWKHKRRDVLVGILISNCGIFYRTQLLEGIKKHIQVDVYGKCGENELKLSCPGHFRADCEDMSHYLFYLALENSKCREYMTEKLFHNAYSRGAIPIIQGPSVEDCINFLPPNSYLHVDNYNTFKDLADEIRRISEDESHLLFYHQWRNHFEVLNEHGFFKTKSFHLCRVCEALNYNDDAVSVYSQEMLERFLDYTKLCRPY